MCEAALARGELNKAEIEAVRFLTKNRSGVHVNKVFDTGRKLVVFVNEGEGSAVRNLWKEYVAFEPNNFSLDELISPVKTRKTKVFLPDGTEGERLLVSEQELRSAGFDVSQVKLSISFASPDTQVRFA